MTTTTKMMMMIMMMMLLLNRLFLPRLNTMSGTVCIDFHYHMFGFHINTLKLIQRQSSTTPSTVWMRSRDQGNRWYEARVELNLTSDTQLVLVASRGQEFSGDIGLDAISILAGPCPSSS